MDADKSLWFKVCGMEYLLTASKSWHLSQEIQGSQYSSVITPSLLKLEEERIDDKDESHHKERPSIDVSQCQFCNLTFCDARKLSHHLKYCKKKSGAKGTIEPENNECVICHVKFQAKQSLKRHLTVHSAERPYQCKKCDWSFKRMSHLKDHVLSHSGKRVHKCKICEKKFKRRGYLLQHIQLSHDCNMCRKCDLVFHDDDNLKTHIATHTQNDNKCEECAKVFQDSSSYKEHFLAVHGGEKAFKCDICSKTFARKANLLTHTKIHASEGEYECHECSRKFNNKSNLNRHLRTHRNEKPYKCEKCGNCYAESHKLAKHRDAHAAREIYSCTIEKCHATFVSKKRFDRHMKLHKTYKFKCEICDTMFYLKGNLNKHMMIHRQQKPLKCPHCENYFRDGSNLSVHLRVHAKENQYNCKMCDRYFANESMHEKHMRRHSEDRRQKCKICDKMLSRKSSMTVHMQAFHDNRKKTYSDRTFSPKVYPSRRKVTSDKALVDTPDLQIEVEDSSIPSVQGRGDTDNVSGLNVKTRPRRHRSDMPYKCVDCFKKFLQVSELIEHIRDLHTDF